MIDVILMFGQEVVMVRINGHSVLFGAANNGNPMMADISGLQLNYSGVVKEFPELKDNPNWRIEAAAKFKDKVRELDSEDKIYDYVVEDLKKFGYIPIRKQKAGHRMEILK